jgi:two-component system, NtrC family, response regulator AtoC
MNKVLVIDDDELVLKTLAVVLKRQGYEYHLAQSAQEALRHAESVEFDIILSDIRMPTVNGVDAVKRIQEDRQKANKKDLPVIFITGFAEDGIQLKAGSLGEIIQKPFDLDQLMITMREYL